MKWLRAQSWSLGTTDIIVHLPSWLIKLVPFSVYIMMWNHNWGEFKRQNWTWGDEIIEKNSSEWEKYTSFNNSHSRLETFPELWILFLVLFIACFMTLANTINLSIPQVDLSKFRLIYPCLLGSQACEVERVNGRKFRKYPKHCLSKSLQSVVIGNLCVSVLDSRGLVRKIIGHSYLFFLAALNLQG